MKVTIEHEFGKNAGQDALVLQLLGSKAPAKAKAATAEEEVVDDILGGEDEVVEEETVTLEQVKTEAQKLIAGNKSANLKGILKKYSAAKVVDLKKADYAAALAEMKKVK